MCKNKLFASIFENRFAILFTGLVGMLLLGASCYMSYAPDSYITLSNLNGAARDMLQRNGRPVIALVYAFWARLGLPAEWLYFASALMALAFLFAAVYVLQYVLKAYIASDFWRVLLCYFTLANVFIIEYFAFFEKGLFIFAILCCVMAWFCMHRFLRDGHIFSLIFAFVCMLVAACTYQGTLAVYIALCLPMVLRYARSVREYFVKGCIAVLPYVTGMLFAFFLTKYVLQNGKVSPVGSLADILGRIPWVISELVWLTRRGAYAIPFDLLEIVIGAALLFNVIGVLCCCKGGRRWAQFAHLLVTFIGILLSSVAVILMGNGWFTPRICYAWGCLAGVYLINLFVNVLPEKTELQGNTWLRVAAYCCILAVTVPQYFGFNEILDDKYTLNYLDEYRSRMIGQQIEEYQNGSGNIVTTICQYRDGDVITTDKRQYKDLYFYGDIAVSAFVPEWSYCSLLNYCLGAQFSNGQPDPYYTEYFAARNWDVYSDEQLVFDGDTLHLCIY